MILNKINTEYLILTFIVLVILIVYFVSGAIIEEPVNKDQIMKGFNWKYIPSAFFLFLGIIVTWMLLKRKANK